ncbi:hypothetical protein BIV57_18470 [Mangrovactinospora gilvigrisea]|uniref:Uncharacterized protein n=1 Tax=Mangrovactinospora gilvigrisea TaxID=1428644 RepID=A0A1J7BBR2_9ACTN|nr:hypothetical protein [Mangrovactinospora gilvigrisea]OIV36037.1 hypothetical protein BIV57_18470 [Mangrovactinospora gilvigrisea]
MTAPPRPDDRRAPRDSSAGPGSMERLSTPDTAPPPPSASSPLPPPRTPSPPIDPIGTPLPPPRRAHRRMPDEVRTSVVRTVILFGCTLVSSMVLAMSMIAGSWFTAFALLVMLVLAVVTACSGLEILVARQVHREHLARGEPCPFDP